MNTKEKEIVSFIKENMEYYPETGTFFWKKRDLGRPSEVQAGGTHGSKNIWWLYVNRRSYPRSHIVWLLEKGHLPRNMPNQFVRFPRLYHLNGNNTDDRIENLTIDSPTVRN